MIRFHSKAGADVLMLDAHAAVVLQALGRSPASQGIFLPEQVAAALEQFEHQPVEPQDVAPATDDQDGEQPQSLHPTLAQRAWPLLDLLRRAQQQGYPVTWSSA